MRPEVLKYLLTGQTQTGVNNTLDAMQATNNVPYYSGPSPEGFTTDPGLIQDSWSQDNTLNTFLNAMASINTGSSKTQLRNLNYNKMKQMEEIYDLQDRIQKASENNDLVTAASLQDELNRAKQKAQEFDQETAAQTMELEEDIKYGSGLTGLIAGGEEDIARRNKDIDLEFKLLSDMFQRDANTSAFNAFKYEFGKDFGSSFGTLGATVAAAFTPKLIKAAIARLVTAEAAGSMAPGIGNAVAAGATLAVLAGDLAVQWKARVQETEAEENDAYEEAVSLLTQDYMLKNNIQDMAELEDPKHQRELNKLSMKAHEELEGLRTKNMGLMFGDVLQSILAVTPFTKVGNIALGTNRWMRTGLKIGALTLNTNMEMNEEGSQWLFTRQYLDKVLGKDTTGLKDTTNYKDDSFSGLLSQASQLASDRFEVEKAIFGNGNSSLYTNSEFISAVNAGALAAGPMMTLPQAASIISDHYGYAKAKSYLGRAAKEQANGEYLRFKYDTYAKYIDNDKEDYFIDSIRSLSKIEGSNITPADAEKEILRFKKAKAEFNKIDDTQYIGGLIEKYDFRGIAREDRKRAIKNSLMIGEYTEQIADLFSLKTDPINPYKAIIDEPTDNEARSKFLSKRKQLFDSLLDPEKAKHLNINEIYDDLDIPIILKERAIARLLKENERIASGEFSKETRENNKLARLGTEAQKSGLSYKYGDQYVKNSNMVGMDNSVKGEKEYIEFLEDLEETSLLRDTDKRSNVQRMLDLEVLPQEILAYAEQVKAPITKEQNDEIVKRIGLKASEVFNKASEVEDSLGDKNKITTIDELNDLMDSAYIEDPDYYQKLKALREEYTDALKLQDRLQEANLIREPKGISTSKVDKEITFVWDRFLKEMVGEVDKANTDSDYLDDSVIAALEKKLKWLKEVLIEEKQLYTNPDKKISVELKNAIEQLEQDLANARKAIRARLADKELAQEESYTIATTNTLIPMGITYTPSTDKDAVVKFNLPLTDAIKDALKIFIDSVLVQDATGKYYLHHSYAIAMNEFVYSTMTDPNDPVKYWNQLIDFRNAKIDDLYLYCKTKFEDLNLYGTPFHLDKALLAKDPETFLTQYLLSVYRSTFLDISHPISQYINTKDITIINKASDESLINPEDGTESTQQIADLRNLFYMLNVVKNIPGNYNHPVVNTKDMLLSEVNLFSTITEYIPTKQQLVTLRELVNWYKGDVLTGPVSVVLGYAGSGKTQVVTKLLLKLLNIDSTKIVSLAPTKSSNKNLAIALGKSDPNDANPLETFLNTDSQVLADSPIIIIDEAGLLSDEQLDKINRKILEAQAINPAVKVVMMGDPTQLSTLTIPPFIAQPIGEYPSKEFMSPLTITYRTDDIDIIRTQKEYRNKVSVVDKVTTALTSDKANGSFGVNSKVDLYNMLIANRGKGRHQLVIVNSAKEVQEVTKELADLGVTNVDVLEIHEAQSHTVDEVYVMLTPTGKLAPRHDGTVAMFNKAMYVATSRAKNLVVIHSPTTKFTNDNKTLIAAEQRKAPTKDEISNFVGELQKQYDNISNSNLNANLKAAVVKPAANDPAQTNSANPTNPKPADPDNEGIVADDDMDQDNDTVDEAREELNKPEDFPIENTQKPQVIINTHNLKYPQYFSIKDKDKKITTGSQVQYVKYWDKANNRAGLAIIAQGADGSWYLIGVIGKDDINEIGKYKLPKEVVDAITSPEFQTRDADDIEWSEFKGKEGKLTTDLGDKNPPLLVGQIGNATPKFFKWGPLKDFREFLDTMYVKIMSTYYSDSGNLESFNPIDDKYNWELKIYNNAEIIKQGLNPRVVRPGVPYQVIKITHKSGKEEVLYVPLTTRRLNLNLDSSVNELRGFLNNIKDLHKILSVLDGDTKIRWGGLKVVPGYDYVNKSTGKTIGRTQAEIFSKLLNPKSEISKKVIEELTRKGVDIATYNNLIKSIRTGLFNPLALHEYGYDPNNAVINDEGTDEDFMSKYFITGDKGSRRAVEGPVKLGENSYTAHPTLKGFYLIEKGNKGLKVWRKVYNFKGLHIKIDIPVDKDPATGKERMPVYEIHSQEFIDQNGGKRNYKRILDGGTKVESGIIHNVDIDPSQYVEELVIDGLINERGNHGPAAKAFDSIARANSSVFIGNKRIYLRQTKQEYKDGVATGHKYFSGLNLLYNPGNGTKAHYIHSHRPTKGEPSAVTVIEELDPITEEVLDALVGDNAFDNNGDSMVNSGFGLRLPMHTKTVNRFPTETEQGYKQRIQDDLIDDFETSLMGIEPTNISINNVSKPVDNPNTTPTDPTDVAHVPQDPRPANDFAADGNDIDLSWDDDTDSFDWTVRDTTTPTNWVTPSLVRQAASEIFGKDFASDPDKLLFLSKAEMIRRFGKDVWGRYEKGVIYLMTNAQGEASIDVLRHEAFHRVTHAYFNAEQRKEIYKLAIQANPLLKDKTNRDIEEWLADSFMSYLRQPNFVSRLLHSFFRKIKSIFNIQLSAQDKIESFFDRIQKGNFTYETANEAVEGTGLNKLLIHAWFGTPEREYKDSADNYNLAQVAILKSLASKISPDSPRNDQSNGIAMSIRTGANGKVYYNGATMTPEDAKFAVYADLKDQFNNLKDKAPIWLKILVGGITEKEVKRANMIYNNVYDYLVQSTDSINLDNSDEPFGDDPSLKDEIEESWRINYESQLLASVKNLMSALFIKQYDAEGNVLLKEYIPRRTVFYISLKLLKGIENFDMNAIQAMSLNATKLGWKDDSGDPKVGRVYDFLVDIIRRAENDKYTSEVTTEVKNGVSRLRYKKAFLPSNLKITQRGFKDGGLYYNNNLVVGTIKGVDYKFTRRDANGVKDANANNYIKRLVAMTLALDEPLLFDIQGQLVPSNKFTEQQLANMYATLLAREEARNLSAGIQAGISSLVERHPYMGLTDIILEEAEDPNSREKPIVTLKTRYIPNSVLGGEQAVKLSIEDGILSVLRDDPQGAIIRQAQSLLELVNKSTDVKANKISTNRETVSKVFNMLGLGKFKIFNLTPIQNEIIINALNGILNNIIGFVDKKESLEAIEDALANDNNNRIKEIMDTLAISQGFGENSRYLDSKNRSSYKFVKGSFLTRMFEKFRRNLDETGETGFKRPDHIDPESIGYKLYYKYNPFLRAKGRVIRELITQEALKQRYKNNVMFEDADTATPYKNEGISGWVVRTLVFGFYSTMLKSDKNPTYIQSPYTPSNKPQNMSFRIPASNIKTMREDIKSALLQQVGRYKWYETLAKDHNIFIKGIPLKVQVLENGTYKYVWTGKLKGGFSKYVDHHLPDNDSLDKIVDNIIEDLDTKAYKFYERIVNNNALVAKLKRGLGDKNYIEPYEAKSFISYLERVGLLNDAKIDSLTKIFNKNYKYNANSKYSPEIDREYNLNLYIIIAEAFKQNYVNGHFLNQFQMSDRSLYPNPTTQIKRASGGISPGDPPKVDTSKSGNGMVDNFNIIVASDQHAVFNIYTDVAKAYNGLYGIQIDKTDAQMYYLPKWKEELEKGYGYEYGIKGVLKSVLYFIDKYGVTRFSKNSGIELSDSLCARFPELADLRKDMEDNNIMEFHHSSAFKVGAPARLLKNGESISDHIATTTRQNGNGIINVPSKYYSIQSNPASSEGDVTNFSQLTYFLNVNKLNTEATKMVYDIDALIMRTNFNAYLRKLGKYVGNKFEINEDKVRSVLAEAVSGMAGYERFEEFIRAKDGKGNYLISLNFPALRNRVEISLMSGAANNSVKSIVGSGNKLVLQADRGVSVFRIGGQVKLFNDLTESEKKSFESFKMLPYHVKEVLKLKVNSYYLNNNSYTHWESHKDMTMEYTALSDSEKELINTLNTDRMLIPTRLNMVSDNSTMDGRIAEVIAPAWWKQYMKAKGSEVDTGDIVLVDDFLTRFAFGVRIPTTGIHSAVPFKIVGFTDSKSNILVAPMELVALHGSDFDVDSLFAIHVEVLVDPKSSLKKTGVRKMIELKDLNGNVIIKEGQRLGWDADINFDSFSMMMASQKATESTFNSVEFDRQIGLIKSLIDSINRNISDNEDAEALKELKAHLKLAESAYVKTLQNKRNFLISWILLRKQNRYDMMQPITFNAVKEDFFDPNETLYHPTSPIDIFGDDGKLTPEFLVELEKGTSTERVISKFKEWGVTADNIQLDIDNNRLNLSDELRNTILADKDISVKMLLKVINNKIDFDVLKDLNDMNDNLQYYLDNFSGVSLTGAFANFVKALSYIYFSTPVGAKFVYNKNSENVKPLDISFNDKVYGSIAEREDRPNGRKIWELLDTLINGAIDNVKEQVLAILNATNNTGATLATMVSLGIPMTDIVSFLRQPVIMKDTARLGTFDVNYTLGELQNIKKSIEAKLQGLGVDTKTIKDDTITSKELQDVLALVGYDSMVSWEGLPKEAIITQYKVLIAYTKLFPIAQKISKTADATNIIRDFPVTEEEIAKVQDNLETISKDSGIEGGSIFDITHIKESKQIFEETLEVREQVLPQRSKAWKERLAGFVNKYLNSNRTSNEDLIHVSREFELYSLSSLTSYDEQDLKWKEPVKITNKVNPDRSFYLYGVDAWIQNFAETLKEYKAKYPDNEFLKLLEPKINNIGTYKGANGEIRIYWVLGSVQQEPGRIATIQVSFMELPEEFQLALLKFSTLSTGLEFGFRGFSTLILPALLGKANAVYNQFNTAMSNDEAFNNLSDHFILPFLLRNQDYVRSASAVFKNSGHIYTRNNAKFNGLLGGRERKNIDAIVYFGDDRETVVNKETGEEMKVKSSTPPLFFKFSNYPASLLYRVDMDETAKTAYYVKVANLKDNQLYKFYSARPDLLAGKAYSLKEAFSNKGNVFSVTPLDFNNDTIETTLKFVTDEKLPAVGDVIQVKSMLDIHNEVLIPYKVNSVKTSDASEQIISTGSGENTVNNNFKVYGSVEVSLTKQKASEQRNVKDSNKVVGSRVVNKLLSKLASKLKFEYEVLDFTNSELVKSLGLNPDIYGFFHNGKVYINSNKYSLETPIHEFGHGLLIMIKSKNKLLYDNLKRNILDSPILAEIKLSYPDLSLEDQIDEAIVTAIGRYGVGLTSGWTNTLISAVKRVYQAIMRVIGLYKPTNITELDPQTSISKLAELMLNGPEFSDTISNVQGTSELRYLNNNYTITKQTGIEGDTGYTVVSSTGRSIVLDRVSTFLGNFLSYNRKLTQAEVMAKKYYGKVNTLLGKPVQHPDGTGTLITYEELLDYFTKVGERSRIAGKIIHKIIQMYTVGNGDPQFQKFGQEKADLLQQYITLGGKDSDFNWIDGNDTYLTALMERLNIQPTDKIHSEFLVYNEQLNLGGTIDMLIEHADGTFSIIDFKTGKSFNPNEDFGEMKYAERTGMLFNSTNNYQMQLGTYALLVKSLYPNARFRNITLVNLNKHTTTPALLEVDKSSVLLNLASYFTHNPNDFIKTNSYLLNHKEYVAISTNVSERINDELKKGAASVFAAKEIVLQRLYEQLDTLRRSGGKDKQPLTDAYINANPLIKKQLESLILQISELEGAEFGSMTDVNADIDIKETYTSVGFNVKNPLLKTFMKLRTRALQLISETRSKLFRESDSLLKDVLKEYYGNNFLSMIGGKIGLNMLNYEKAFKFMWDTSEEDGMTIKTETSTDWALLSTAQKKYNVFYRDSIRDMLFSTLSTTRGLKYYKNKLDNVDSDLLIGLFTKQELTAKYQAKIDMYLDMEPVEKWEAELGKYFVYTEDFTPRLPKLTGEYSITETKEIINTLGNWALHKVTAYSAKPADTFGLRRAGVPLKYINNYNAHSPNQTMHTELIMKLFAKNMINKRFYDNVSAYGLSLATIFESGGSKIGAMKNSANFLRSYIDNNLHEVYNEEENNLASNIHKRKKVLGIEVSGERVLRTTMGLATMAKLSFSTLGATVNLVLNQLNTVKDAVKGSIAKRIDGIEEDDINWSLSTLTQAYGIYFQHLYNKLTGKVDKLTLFDDIYNIKQQQFISANSKQMLTMARNKAVDDRWLYMTYGLGDSLANSLIFISILKNKKIKTANGETNMWDAYNIKDGQLVWEGGTRGVTESGEVISGMTAQELLKFKKIMARIVGEYDPEMKRKMESNAFTAMFLQFKKFIPNKFEMAFQGEFENASLGKYIEVLDHDSGKPIEVDGNPVLRWEAQLDKGMFWLAGSVAYNDVILRGYKMMMRGLYLNKAMLNDSKESVTVWSTLSPEQKQLVLNQYLNLFVWVAGTMGIIYAYGDADDDDKDVLKRRSIDLLRDLTIEFNILEMLNLVNKPTVILPALLETGEGVDKLFFSGLLEGNTNRDGDLVGMKDATTLMPFSVAYNQLIKDPWYNNY